VHGGVPTQRVVVAGGAMLAACVLTAPALLATSLYVALPLLVAGAACVGGENPPMDAARLDVVRGTVWGRAEGVRTLLKSGAQAASPVAFGLLADHAFGGGGSGLRDAFLVMLVPLLVGGVLLLTLGRRWYPGDVRRAQTEGERADRPVDAPASRAAAVAR
jgi:MFS family permease